ncbi:MAG: EAL domain-containing protein [Candidatus Competibacteraceae bacterium]|nr:EAL domain-containing protein [Candidatus Competibacteraceae bacterium]
MRSPPHPGFFLSLKWKALLLSSLVLIVIAGTVVAINHIELHNQFEQRRAELQIQYAHQAQGLLDQSDKRLRQWSTTIAALLAARAGSRDAPEEEIIAEFERLAAILELNMGVENILLISSDGRQLAARGLEKTIDERTTLVAAVRRVVTSEVPMSLIDCFETCLQYVITPILGVGDALVVGVSLADVVLDFQRVSGTDLGLIVGLRKTEAVNGLRERWLRQWDAQVVALGNAHVNMEVLRAAAQINTLSVVAAEPAYIRLNRRDYEVRLFQLTGFKSRENAYLVIVADISDAMAKIGVTLRRNILVGALGLVLSEFLLLAILWAPMSRLRRAAANLPWLAEGAFGKVREAISGSPSAHILLDEVDILNDTAIALSHQLEALHIEVANHTRDLSERMNEIMRQRNFVTQVLETAQAIILTQNEKNEILLINSYGLAITGFTLAELRGRPFVTLLSLEQSINEAMGHLAGLVAGEREHIEEECDIRCKDSSTLNVVWQHSRLKDSADDASLILSVGMDITARKKAELRLAWLADHDPLTRLYNRRRFTKELKEAVATAKRYRRSGALLFLDLDQFKYINDTSGHRAGDRLLQRLGELLASILREVDVIGRLGGDEFAVILNQSNATEAILVAKKMLAHIQEIEFPVDEQIHKLSASIGITLFPEHGIDSEDLLARADLAMYQVKESGRGGWYLLSSSDQSQRLLREKVFWKQRVERALKENEFLLYAQPIMDIQSQTVSHYEVLLRMQGDNGEIIGPIHFIEVAERSGLIHAIDRMVMSEAIRYQALAKARGLEITLTVNLSAHAFNNPDLLHQLQQLLQETGLEPRQLIFEMTETAAVADIMAARHLMRAINEIGCKFALDDFGTGFSSFYYLRTLPFEFVKIDGSFVKKLSEQVSDQVLVKAMREIAKAFGKKTIAEHVEDEKTLALLAEYGIDYAQGYYIGYPVPIMTVLEQQNTLSRPTDLRS